jgi:hypothetical protein
MIGSSSWIGVQYLPVLIDKVETILEENGLRHDSIVMRMTGCPNGCARPYIAGKVPLRGLLSRELTNPFFRNRVRWKVSWGVPHAFRRRILWSTAK